MRFLIPGAILIALTACITVDPEPTNEWDEDTEEGELSEIPGLYCGSVPDDACELYVCALVDCYNQAEEPLPIGYTLETACPNYDASQDELYTCYANAWAAADCTNGINAASASATACTQ